jgi:hypothetical protein
MYKLPVKTTSAFVPNQYRPLDRAKYLQNDRIYLEPPRFKKIQIKIFANLIFSAIIPLRMASASFGLNMPFLESTSFSWFILIYFQELIFNITL